MPALLPSLPAFPAAHAITHIQVLAEEAKMADESEMKLFSIVAKIDPNADKVVTTT